MLITPRYVLGMTIPQFCGIDIMTLWEGAAGRQHGLKVLFTY